MEMNHDDNESWIASIEDEKRWTFETQRSYARLMHHVGPLDACAGTEMLTTLAHSLQVDISHVYQCLLMRLGDWAYQVGAGIGPSHPTWIEAGEAARSALHDAAEALKSLRDVTDLGNV